ncbi:hypothetical protein P3T76_007434 [Phytophthora citrophthora]|uniref:Uncharacterized protein n=1 Tax=Phytophthora citrophthora TaxID=4793 RepID=A0AAD9GNV8_9STRA|nr:hypothetical protein P3T76_007434 [Phytophthora citrophthora]
MRETLGHDRDYLGGTVRWLRSEIEDMEHFRDDQAEEILRLNTEIARLRSGTGATTGGAAIAVFQSQQHQHTAEHQDSEQWLARIQTQLDVALEDLDHRQAELHEAGEAEIELQHKLRDRERKLAEVRHDLALAQHSLDRRQRDDLPSDPSVARLASGTQVPASAEEARLNLDLTRAQAELLTARAEIAYLERAAEDHKAELARVHLAQEDASASGSSVPAPDAAADAAAISSLEQDLADAFGNLEIVQHDRDQLSAKSHAIVTQRDRAVADRDQVRLDRTQAVQDLHRVTTDRDRIQADLNTVTQDRQVALADREAVRAAREATAQELSRFQQQNAALRQTHRKLGADYAEAEQQLHHTEGSSAQLSTWISDRREVRAAKRSRSASASHAVPPSAHKRPVRSQSAPRVPGPSASRATGSTKPTPSATPVPGVQTTGSLALLAEQASGQTVGERSDTSASHRTHTQAGQPGSGQPTRVRPPGRKRSLTTTPSTCSSRHPRVKKVPSAAAVQVLTPGASIPVRKKGRMATM